MSQETRAVVNMPVASVGGPAAAADAWIISSDDRVGAGTTHARDNDDDDFDDVDGFGGGSPTPPPFGRRSPTAISAHMSVLGNGAGGTDFLSRARRTTRREDRPRPEDGAATPPAPPATAALTTRIKGWFSSSSCSHPAGRREGGGGAADDDDDDDARGYRDFASIGRDGGGDNGDDDPPPRRRANSEWKEDVDGRKKDPLDDDSFDVSLLKVGGRGRRTASRDGDHHDDDDDGRGGGGVEWGGGVTRRPKKRSWSSSTTTTTTSSSGRSSSSSRRGAMPAIPLGAEEEERIMGECSFFYYRNMDSVGGGMATDDASPPRGGHLVQDRDDDDNDNDEDYDDCDNDDAHDADRLGRRRGHRLDKLAPNLPRAAALPPRDVQTRARRRWTERRYRRRLRQSPQLGASRDHHLRDRDDDEAGGDYSPYYRASAAEPRARDGLAEEHRRAFFAAHSALNGRLRDAPRRGGRVGPEYDIDYDLELAELGDDGDPSASDAGEGGGGGGLVTRSSLAMRGGLIRLPADNVRLVCDPQLQPGILSIETTSPPGSRPRTCEDDGCGSKGRGRPGDPRRRRRRRLRGPSKGEGDGPRQGGLALAYVLTVDMQIYQRVVQEMGDSYRIPCGMYYCCHVTATGGNHVGIGVAVAILMLLFVLLIAGMIAGGMD